MSEHFQLVLGIAAIALPMFGGLFAIAIRNIRKMAELETKIGTMWEWWVKNGGGS